MPIQKPMRSACHLPVFAEYMQLMIMKYVLFLETRNKVHALQHWVGSKVQTDANLFLDQGCTSYHVALDNAQGRHILAVHQHTCEKYLTHLATCTTLSCSVLRVCISVTCRSQQVPSNLYALKNMQLTCTCGQPFGQCEPPICPSGA